MKFKKETMAIFLKYYMVILRYMEHDHGRKTVKAAGNVDRGSRSQKVGEGRGWEKRSERGRAVRAVTLRQPGLPSDAGVPVCRTEE